MLPAPLLYHSVPLTDSPSVTLPSQWRRCNACAETFDLPPVVVNCCAASPTAAEWWYEEAVVALYGELAVQAGVAIHNFASVLESMAAKAEDIQLEPRLVLPVRPSQLGPATRHARVLQHRLRSPECCGADLFSSSIFGECPACAGQLLRARAQAGAAAAAAAGGATHEPHAQPAGGTAAAGGAAVHPPATHLAAGPAAAGVAAAAAGGGAPGPGGQQELLGALDADPASSAQPKHILLKKARHAPPATLLPGPAALLVLIATALLSFFRLAGPHIFPHPCVPFPPSGGGGAAHAVLGVRHRGPGCAALVGPQP